MSKKPTLADINERNKEFWKEIQERIDPLLEEPKSVRDALDDMADEALRDIPVKKRKSLEASLLRNEQITAPFRVEVDRLRPDADKGRKTLEQQRKNQKKAVAEVRKYGPEDKAVWQQIADEPALARMSKSSKAERIAKRLDLDQKAISTIRRAIK